MREAEQIRRSLELLPLIGRGASWADAGDARVAGHKALDSLLQRLERLEASVVLSLGCIEDFVPRWEPLKIDVVSKLRAAITQEEERK